MLQREQKHNIRETVKRGLVALNRIYRQRWYFSSALKFKKVDTKKKKMLEHIRRNLKRLAQLDHRVKGQSYVRKIL